MVLETDTRRCTSEDAGPPRWVDCEIPHRLKRRTKHSLEGCGNLGDARFKNLEGKFERENPKKTISASCELEPLHKYIRAWEADHKTTFWAHKYHYESPIMLRD